jgi:catechol 2,3-dioxygenase-like lactoylglutathione lyase family enzyme
MTVEIVSIDHLVFNVADVEISAVWYENMFGVTRKVSGKTGATECRTSLMFGRQKINLRPISASKEAWFTADRASIGSNDVCFLTEATPEDVVRHLEKLGIPREQGPIEKQGARGTLVSVYCRDPDGSLIEISSYKR